MGMHVIVHIVLLLFGESSFFLSNPIRFVVNDNTFGWGTSIMLLLGTLVLKVVRH
jgi:hypothetical protein